jgi:hypothetical protein
MLKLLLGEEPLVANPANRPQAGTTGYHRRSKGLAGPCRPISDREWQSLQQHATRQHWCRLS